MEQTSSGDKTDGFCVAPFDQRAAALERGKNKSKIGQMLMPAPNAAGTFSRIDWAHGRGIERGDKDVTGRGHKAGQADVELQKKRKKMP